MVLTWATISLIGTRWRDGLILKMNWFLGWKHGSSSRAFASQAWGLNKHVFKHQYHQNKRMDFKNVENRTGHGNSWL
jgi:hypothetical protein